MTFFSLISFILILLFLELCVFIYFTPNLKEFILKKGNVDDSFYNRKEVHNDDNNQLEDTIEFIPNNDNEDDFDYSDDEDSEIKPLEFEEQEWVSDELDDDEIKELEFKEEEWKEDAYESKSKNATSLLLSIDPDFKIDDFYLSIFELYSDISNHYTDDDLKSISDKLGRELYIANVKQMDSLRKRNLKHVVEVENYLNCQILASKIIDRDLYVKVELRISCLDYIYDKSSEKVVSGSKNKMLLCTYRMVLKRQLNQLRINNPGMSKQQFKPVLKSGTTLNDDNWILEGNVIVKRKKN